MRKNWRKRWRRHERTVQEAYDIEGLGTVQQVQRVVQITVLGTLRLETSVAKSRTLAYPARASLKALEARELGERSRRLSQP